MKEEGRIREIVVLQLGGLGLGGGLPLLPLSHSVFFYSYGSVMRRVEQKENGIWLFVTQKYVLERYGSKEMGLGGGCVCTRAHKCVPLIC